MAKDPAKVRAVLERHYPEYDYSDFEGAHYWKSLDEKQPGDPIEHNGHTFKVLYAWEWVKYSGIPVYMAEVEPV